MTVPSKKQLIPILYTLFLVVGILLLQFIGNQHDFATILGPFIIAFMGWFGLMKEDLDKVYFFSLIIILGCCSVWGMPTLSDDIYRFYWDGRLLHNGISPFAFTPDALMQMGMLPSELEKIYEYLNSPAYFSIYPPISQTMFYLASSLGDIFAFATLLKLMYIVIHIAGYVAYTKLITHTDQSSPFRLGKWYFINPLVIVEGIGNLHAEILVVSSLVGMMYYWNREKWIFAALFLAFGIAIKMLPLMLVPFIFFTLKPKPKIQFFVTLIIVLFVLFIPMLYNHWSALANSTNLYFQKFEFNASVYYVLRYLGQLAMGYNLIWYIGPLLALTTVFLIVRTSYLKKSTELKSIFYIGYFSYFIYLLLATTVHPWYLITPLFFSLLLGYRHIAIWTVLIILSYSSYDGEVYHERLWVIGLEYVLLVVALYWDFRRGLHRAEIV